jgi:hypothetical protein
MLAYIAFLCLAAEPSALLTIEQVDDARHVRIIAQLPPELAKNLPVGDVASDAGQPVLSLCLLGADGKPGPAMLGKYRRDGDRLTLVPRYALAHEHMYRAIFRVSATRTETRDYQVPARKATPPATVERIYPTSDVLPANQLKFYIYFSKPMREGEAIFDRIEIVDERGKPVDDPWRRTELWTADAKRFSLWIHPGRIKTGVNLREEFGPVLEPNKTYKLVIKGQVEDADGQPLGKDVVKTFRTTEPDGDRPLPQAWRLTPPRAGTRQPLRLDFGESLDHALMQRCIEVRGEVGAPLDGTIRPGDKETSWLFEPREPWQATDYSVRVDELLEDLAGNTPTRVFDTDLDKPSGPKPKLTLPFRPK